MATDPVHVGSYRPLSPARILPAHTTRPVFVFASADAAAAAGTTPATAGGSRLFGLSAAQFQSTPAALSVRLFAARRLTKVPDMGTAAITTNTITRTGAGSFIADGWLVGDSIGFRNTANLPAVEPAQVMAVSATTLTFAASTFTAETPPATAEFWRLHMLGTSVLASGAGSVAGTAALDLFTDSKPFMDASPNRALAIGPGSGFFAALLSTLPANGYVDITPLPGDY